MENKKVKILAIDDNSDNLVSIKALIREAFPMALVSTALSGVKGIELATSENPDVILLDILMPGMDGFEVCNRFKADKCLRDIPVVFVTASQGERKDRIQALECGAEAFLTKPIDESELTAQIRAMVKIKQANDEKHNEKQRLEALITERTLELNKTHQATLHLLDDLEKENQARKKSEEALHTHEERFRHISDSISDMSFSCRSDPDGVLRLDWIYGAYEKITGCPRDELLAMECWGKMVIEEDFPLFKKHILDVKPGSSDICQLRIRNKGGGIVWIQASSKCIKQKIGNRIYLYGAILDISERKLADDKLQHLAWLYALLGQINQSIVRIREQDELFRTICKVAVEYGQFHMAWIGLRDKTDNKIIPVAWAGLEDRYLDQIKIIVGHETYGKGPSGVACKLGKLIICNDIATDPTMIPWRDEALKRGYRSLVAVPFSRKGETFGVLNLFAAEPEFFNKDEQKLLQEIGEDISFALDAMASEAERKAADEALRESENFLKETQIIADLGAYSFDIPTGKWSSSEVMDKIFGIEPDYDRTYEGWISIIHPEWQSTMSMYFIQNVICNETNFDKEYLIVRKNDQAERWVHGLGKFKYNEDKQPVMMVGTIQDITERKLIEVELIAAKERAEESDRLKTAFLANMSHEIRTPMNGILGFAGLLKEPRLTGEEQQEYISIIEKSGSRMLNIINDIISISKVESGQMNITYSPTNINEQIEYIYTFFKPEADQKGLQLLFKKSLPSHAAIITTDREKVYAILTNLVKNAIKFTDRGTIEIGYFSDSANLTFYVRDTGIGIPKDRQKAIFDRFVQADIGDKRAFQGAGLGLAISKAYAEMLGGRITVESEEEQGSFFCFTLPYHIIPPQQQGLQHGGGADGKGKQMPNLKILIAEDDETSEMLISMGVKAFGKDILKVRTGIEAVEICRKNPDIDLVLMDIKMPLMNGYEATRQIRQFNNDVVILAQTAYALVGDRDKAIEAGCNDYIAKPFGCNELKELIKKYF